MIALRFLLRRLVRRAAHQTFAGRLVERARPERGRFLAIDVDAIVAQAWRNLDEMLPEAHLDRIPALGNRQNVYLAVLTLAAYRAFVDAGIEREYAIELFADVGWSCARGYEIGDLRRGGTWRFPHSQHRPNGFRVPTTISIPHEPSGDKPRSTPLPRAAASEAAGQGWGSTVAIAPAGRWRRSARRQ